MQSSDSLNSQKGPEIKDLEFRKLCCTKSVKYELCSQKVIEIFPDVFSIQFNLQQHGTVHQSFQSQHHHKQHFNYPKCRELCNEDEYQQDEMEFYDDTASTVSSLTTATGMTDDEFQSLNSEDHRAHYVTTANDCSGLSGNGNVGNKRKISTQLPWKKGVDSSPLTSQSTPNKVMYDAYNTNYQNTSQVIGFSIEDGHDNQQLITDDEHDSFNILGRNSKRRQVPSLVEYTSEDDSHISESRSGTERSVERHEEIELQVEGHPQVDKVSAIKQIVVLEITTSLMASQYAHTKPILLHNKKYKCIYPNRLQSAYLDVCEENKHLGTSEDFMTSAAASSQDTARESVNSAVDISLNFPSEHLNLTFAASVDGNKNETVGGVMRVSIEEEEEEALIPDSAMSILSTTDTRKPSAPMHVMSFAWEKSSSNNSISSSLEEEVEEEEASVPEYDYGLEEVDKPEDEDNKSVDLITSLNEQQQQQQYQTVAEEHQEPQQQQPHLGVKIGSQETTNGTVTAIPPMHLTTQADEPSQDNAQVDLSPSFEPSYEYVSNVECDETDLSSRKVYIGRYTGRVLNDLLDGQGEIIYNKRHTDGFVSFTGEWSKGNKINGKLIYKNGLTYEGDLINNKPNVDLPFETSYEVDILGETAAYEGDQVTGFYETNNYNVQVKRKKKNKPIHTCVYSFTDGRTYTGQSSSKEIPNPTGIMTYPNGDKFVGVWMGDYPLYGQMTRVNGDVYTGEFYNGVYEGFGTLNFGGGSPHFHYVGKWKDGLRHGEGDEFGPNLDGSVDIDGKGTKYSGTWENDQRHGCFQCESACTSLFKAYYFHGTHEIYDRFTLAKFRQRGGEGVVK